MLNVLALEPWYGGSHKNFLDGLVGHSRHRFHAVTMAARFWKWRMHGGAVTLARKAAQALGEGFRPDVLFATDMVNLPAFLALMRGALSDVPGGACTSTRTSSPTPSRPRPSATPPTPTSTTSPASPPTASSSTRGSTTTPSWRRCPACLRAFPDYTHLHTVGEIRKKSTVLHLGIDLAGHDAYADVRRQRRPGEAPIVLWNQRWEYDKRPEAFFHLMNRLDDAGCAFRLILAGEHFERQPREFEQAFERYAERILHYGYAEDFEEYSRLLHRADVVVSTARHEFFGIAMMEAIYCGCHPLLPNRLSYPELIPDALHRPLLHAPVLYENDEDLFHVLHDLLRGRERSLPPATLKGIPERLAWPEHAAAYDDLLADIHEAKADVAG